MRRLVIAVLALTALAGCGDASEPTAERPTQAPSQPFPPRAAEPPQTVRGAATPTGQIVRIGGHPEGIAIDAASGTLAVATDGTAPALACLDAATLEVRRSVPLPADARHVQAGGGQFLVPLERVDELAVVPADCRGARTLVKVGDEPHDAAAVGSDVVVGDEFGGTVSVVRGGRVRATVPVDVQPGGVAAVGDHQVAIVSVRAYTVALLDLRALRLGPSQSAGLGPSHAVAGDGRLFVSDTRGGAVLEYATRPRLKAVARLSGVGAPYGLALDERRQRLWVTDVRGGRLLAVDVRRAGYPRVARTWAAVAQPNSVAVDVRTGAAVVAGQRGGLLQRVAP